MTTNSSQLPPGNTSFINGIRDTYKFYHNATEFARAKALSYNTSIFRARIINRNVVFLTGYNETKKALEMTEDLGLSSREAYAEFMETILSDRNIVMRNTWDPAWQHWRSTLVDQHVIPERLSEDLYDMTISVVDEHICSWLSTNDLQDIYEISKALLSDVIMHLFLGFSNQQDQDRTKTLHLVKMIFRGITSASMDIKTSFYQSPRSKAKEAHAEISRIFQEQLEHKRCPIFCNDMKADAEQIVIDHAPLFVSSLVIKSLTSYLSSSLLQIHTNRSHLDKLRTCNNDIVWRSYLLEVERLNPPLIGVLRRTTRDTTAFGWMIPKSYDIWLHFSLANRDPSVYSSPDHFLPSRWVSDENNGSEPPPEPLVWGLGPKTCIGREFCRNLLMAILQRIVETCDMCIDTKQEQLLNDCPMKQLPVQKPLHPVFALVQAIKK